MDDLNHQFRGACPIFDLVKVVIVNVITTVDKGEDLEDEQQAVIGDGKAGRQLHGGGHLRLQVEYLSFVLFHG